LAVVESASNNQLQPSTRLAVLVAPPPPGPATGVEGPPQAVSKPAAVNIAASGSAIPCFFIPYLP